MCMHISVILYCISGVEQSTTKLWTFIVSALCLHLDVGMVNPHTEQKGGVISLERFCANVVVLIKEQGCFQATTMCLEE